MDFQRKIHTVILHTLPLVEWRGMEPWILAGDCKVMQGFSTAQGVCFPNPCIVQGSTAIPSDTAQDMKGTEIMMYLFHIFYYIFQTLVSDIAWNEHISV